MNDEYNDKFTISASDIKSFKNCQKQWSFNKELDILKDFQNHKSIEQIEKVYHISKNTIKQILKKYKLA